MWNAFAIGASWATAISPPAATSVNIAYITQNTGLRTVCTRVESPLPCRQRMPVSISRVESRGGLTRNSPQTTMTAPWMIPNVVKVRNGPADSIIATSGVTVSAAPAPNPATVSPTARPRLRENHFTALGTQVP